MAGSFWLDESTSIRYTVGRAFSYGEGEDRINYTKAGATPQTFASLGFVEVQVDPTPDSRFYTYSNPENDGTYQTTPRALEDATDEGGAVTSGLKSNFIAEQKRTAGSLLSPSDWYVTREAETGTAVPAEITTYRAAVRTTCDSREAAITAVTTVEELEALVKAPDIVLADPTDPDSGMIENPEAHLEPWPEQ